jgi:hypothetical protein
MHFSKTNVASFNTGEKIGAYYYDGIYKYQATTETRSIELNAGETLTINYRGDWYNDGNSITYTFEDLAGNNISDIWLMNNEFYTVKPDNWAD